MVHAIEAYLHTYLGLEISTGTALVLSRDEIVD